MLGNARAAIAGAESLAIRQVAFTGVMRCRTTSEAAALTAMENGSQSRECGKVHFSTTVIAVLDHRPHPELSPIAGRSFCV